MTRFRILLGREVGRTLCQPLAYIVMACLFILTGVTFQTSVILLNAGPSPITLVESFFNSFLFWFPFLLSIPLLTMRVFSEEYRLGTIETLMTAPVRDGEVVLAKFLGALLFFIFVWLPTLLYFAVFWWVTGVAPAETVAGLLGGYLLLFLAGSFYLSVGVLASALTDNQIVAAVVGAVVAIVFFFFGLLWFFFPGESPLIRSLAFYVSTIEHMAIFSRGVFDSRPIIFYLSLTGFTLLLTYHALQYRRWRK